MQRFALGIFALIILSMGTFLAPKPAHAEFACGVVDGKTLKSCEVINKQTLCTEKCEPVNMVKVCTTKCDGACHTTAATTCVGGCETDCLKVCTPDPIKYDCKTECTTHCEASCSGHCSTSVDKTACSGHCKASCGETCTEKCAPLPPTETCVNKCNTSCSASCTVESDTACTVQCETGCTTETKGACTTDCTTTEGALFCDGQYIDPTVPLAKCVTEIEASGEKVSGYLTVTGNGTLTVQGEGGGCTASPTSANPASAALLTAFVGLGLLLRRRIRAKSQV